MTGAERLRPDNAETDLSVDRESDSELVCALRQEIRQYRTSWTPLVEFLRKEHAGAASHVAIEKVWKFIPHVRLRS